MARQTVSPIFHKGRNGTGMLLLHGFTGTPLDMELLADLFRGAGCAVAVPLLAGHGETPEALKKTTWSDWLRSAEEARRQLRLAGAKSLFAIGHSMGGLLCLKLALRYRFQAIATLSSPIFTRNKNIKYARYLKWIKPYIRRTEKKAPHIEKHLRPYPRVPLAAIDQLYRLIQSTKNDLPNIQTPIFIGQGGSDETVDPTSADYIYQHIGSNYKKLCFYPRSTHIITRDYDYPRVNRDVARFFERARPFTEGKSSITANAKESR